MLSGEEEDRKTQIGRSVKGKRSQKMKEERSGSRDGNVESLEIVLARNKESAQSHTESRNAFSSRLTLTVADFFAGQVVSRGEAVFGHRHVGVKGQRQQAR